MPKAISVDIKNTIPEKSGRWLSATLAFAAFTMMPAFAQEEPRLVTPSEATTGTLLFESSIPGKFIQAPALVTDVEINISGPIARTIVTQRFKNTSEGWVEGVYVFPLPDESAVDTMRMQIGDRFIEGQIEEKVKAKQIYEAAKAAGQKTALLEQERPNLFTNSVANIGPGETIVIQIEYQETVKIDASEFSLRFPMVVAPRYNPAPNVIMANLDETGFAMADPVPDRDRITPPVLNPVFGPINPVHLSVNLEAGFAVGEIKSAYHKIVTTWDGDKAANLTLEADSVPANRDFELTWIPKPSSVPSAALFVEEIAGDPYYLLMVTPPSSDIQVAPPAREVTFVIDTSGSMGGESIRQARRALAMAVQRLKAGDTFNVIEFNSDTFTLFDRPQPVTSETLGQALKWVEGLEARGGTEMLPALRAALSAPDTGDTRLQQVIFLTDGAIGNEQALFGTISRNRGDARIFTIGIGSAPNSFFMSRAAEIGQGTFTHIGDIDEVAERMGALFVKLENPAITNLATDWPSGTDLEVWPSPIPDVYKGETLVIAARADTTDGMLWVSGLAGNQPWKVGMDLSAAAPRTGVSKLWARKKIASLDRARGGRDFDKLDKTILSVALTHTLVSRLTSLVAVDVTPSRPDGVQVTTQAMPTNLPAGWDFERVFGDASTFSSERPLQGLKVALPQDADAPGQPKPANKGVSLPQTATLADVSIFKGLLMMLAAMGLFFWTRQPKLMPGRVKETRSNG